MKISERHFTPQILRAFARSLPPKLDALSLCKLSFSSLAVANKFVELVTSMEVAALEIKMCVMTPKMLRRVVAALPRMKTLVLFLDHQSVDVSQLPCLRSLSLTSCTILGDLSCEGVSYLNLSGCDLRNLDWSKITGVRHLVLRDVFHENVFHENVFHQGVFAKDYTIFASFMKALFGCAFVTVCLENNNLGDSDVLELLKVCVCETLMIGAGNALTDASLEPLLKQTQIANVCLSGADITDAGIVQNCGVFHRNLTIKSLNVCNTYVSAQVLKWVEEANRVHAGNKTHALIASCSLMSDPDSPWKGVCEDMWREMGSYL